MKSVPLGLAILAASLSNVQSLQADLDQSFDPTGNRTLHSTIGSPPLGKDLAQTFTVGLTGVLTGVDVYVMRLVGDADLIVEVRPTVGGVPVESDVAALASVVIPRASVPLPSDVGFTSVDLTSFRVNVLAGQVLAIVLRTQGQTTYQWEGSAGNKYVGGALFSRSPSWAVVHPNFDLGFQTFVQPFAIPTVTEWGLAIMTLLLLTGTTVKFRRRRHIAAA